MRTHRLFKTVAFTFTRFSARPEPSCSGKPSDTIMTHISSRNISTLTEPAGSSRAPPVSVQGDPRRAQESQQGFKYKLSVWHWHSCEQLPGYHQTIFNIIAEQQQELPGNSKPIWQMSLSYAVAYWWNIWTMQLPCLICSLPYLQESASLVLTKADEKARIAVWGRIRSSSCSKLAF